MSSTAWAWRSVRSKGASCRLLRAASAEAAARIGADDRVQHADRLEQAFEDVGALARLLEVELAAAADDLAAEVDVVLERCLEADGARLAVDQGQHVDGEGGLHRCVLVERVEHGAGLAAAAQLDDDAHALAVGLVAQVADAFDLARLDQLGDAGDQRCLVHLERQLGDDDLGPSGARLLDVGAGADDDAAAAVGVSLLDRLAAEDDAAGGEVRALDDVA